jgi:uncharacterized protein YraI
MTCTLLRNLQLWKTWVNGVVVVGLLLIAAKCNYGLTSTPTPIARVPQIPEITGFTLVPCGPVPPSATITIQVNVKRNGCRIGKYRWWIAGMAEKGILKGQGTPLITYQSPAAPDSYEVWVELEYEGGSVKGSTMVEVVPTDQPISELTEEPTEQPTEEPTEQPTEEPTEQPTEEPTEQPTEEPTIELKAIVVSASGLCLRDGPGLNYNVAGYLKNGEILDIRGRNAGRNWIKVMSASSSKEGWVSAAPEYVKINVDWDTIPVVEVPPPPTPATFPDALVIASGGVVPLRSGPGDNYDLICTLPDDTPLDVLRRVHNKDNWIKVAVNPDSDERMEGYVTTAAGLIKVNVDLDDVPPIYEFGPKLYEPKPSVQRALEEPITFKWQDYGVLEEQQYYSLIVYRSDLSEKDACYHDQHKAPEVLIKPEDYDGCTPGVYYWGVGVATKILGEDGKPMLGEDGGPIWRDDSERDHRRIIGLGVPPPDTHEGDTQDSGELPWIP